MLSTLVLSAIIALSVRAANVNYTFNVANGVASPDGFNRSATLVNGKFPGPVLTANKGDTIYVEVNNQLTDPAQKRSTTIHWHGMFQNRTAYNDGPAMVTQCPIAPGNSYTYGINTGGQAGTFWYHSHFSTQYTDGLRGPLIVYDPDDPYAHLYDVDDESSIITLDDWYHNYSTDLATAFKSPTVNPGIFNPSPDSGLINGVGRFVGGSPVIRAVVGVTCGKRYRFRILNTSTMAAFRFSIEGHSLTVIEADGENHQPLVVDSFDIYAGQRISVVVEANQTVGNYWIRAPMTLDHPGNNTNLNTSDVFAVLRYDGAAEVEPITPQGTASGKNLAEADLAPLIDPESPGGNADPDKIVSVVFSGGPVNGSNVFTINNQTYGPPSVPTLLQILSENATTTSDFAASEIPFVINHGDLVEVQISGFPGHPFHLHGHSFSVIKSASSPQVNFVNPPRRDVVVTDVIEPIRIRFRADNSGPWFLHCHIDWHLNAGLAAIIVEDPAGTRSNVKPTDAWSNLCPIYEALDPSLQ